MQTPSRKTIFKNEDYLIQENNIYSTKESWWELHWIAQHNMPSMSFVLVCLTSPLEPIRHISEIMDGSFDFIAHASELPTDFKFGWPKAKALENIEHYLTKRNFSLYQ